MDPDEIFRVHTVDLSDTKRRAMPDHNPTDHYPRVLAIRNYGASHIAGFEEYIGEEVTVSVRPIKSSSKKT
jgi:hypothetical protein